MGGKAGCLAHAIYVYTYLIVHTPGTFATSPASPAPSSLARSVSGDRHTRRGHQPSKGRKGPALPPYRTPHLTLSTPHLNPHIHTHTHTKQRTANHLRHPRPRPRPDPVARRRRAGACLVCSFLMLAGASPPQLIPTTPHFPSSLLPHAQVAIADQEGRPLTCVATRVDIESRPLVSPLAYQVRTIDRSVSLNLFFMPLAPLRLVSPPD